MRTEGNATRGSRYDINAVLRWRGVVATEPGPPLLPPPLLLLPPELVTPLALELLPLAEPGLLQDAAALPWGVAGDDDDVEAACSTM